MISPSFTEITLHHPALAKYSVGAPTNIKITQTFSSVQVVSNTSTAAPWPSTQNLGLGEAPNGVPLSGHFGIETKISATTPGSNGLLAMVQTGDQCQAFTSNDETSYSYKLGPLVDAPGNTPLYDGVSSPVSSGYDENDSPFSTFNFETATFTSFYEQEHFADTLMYQPSPIAKTAQTAIWVPIGSVNWYWNGTAMGTPPQAFSIQGPAYTGNGGIKSTSPPAPPTWIGVLQSTPFSLSSSKPSNC